MPWKQKCRGFVESQKPFSNTLTDRLARRSAFYLMVWALLFAISSYEA